jgi:hypothetical protein
LFNGDDSLRDHPIVRGSFYLHLKRVHGKQYQRGKYRPKDPVIDACMAMAFPRLSSGVASTVAGYVIYYEVLSNQAPITGIYTDTKAEKKSVSRYLYNGYRSMFHSECQNWFL